jgi:chorismate synthase
MIRYLTAGESHGEALIGIVEGIPAGLDVDARYIDRHLARRWLGFLLCKGSVDKSKGGSLNDRQGV